MRHRIALAVLTAALVACSPDVPTAPQKVLRAPSAVANGFDQYGYNDVARVFVGAADGIDRNLDDKLWGDPTYANDHLVMKWNKAWETCNANRSPANCAGAWLTNEWNGKVTGGSGETWHYKFQWIGTCGGYGTPLPDGGYCIWGEYEVIFSQGTVANQHFWDAHAKPAGFGN